MPVSGRIYQKGSISIPYDNVDIKILSNPNNNSNIGKARIVENEIGLFAIDIEYSINIKKLNEIQESNISNLISEKKLDKEKARYTKDLTIALYGHQHIYEYVEFNSVEFKFLYHDLFTSDVIDEIDIICRELKIDYLLNEY